jgi:hypothetical protein
MTSSVLMSVNPAALRSLEHPDVTFVTIDARVSLLQEPAEHMPDTHEVTGSTSESLAPVVSARLTRPPALRHVDASGFDARLRSTDWQPEEIL